MLGKKLFPSQNNCYFQREFCVKQESIFFVNYRILNWWNGGFFLFFCVFRSVCCEIFLVAFSVRSYSNKPFFLEFRTWINWRSFLNFVGPLNFKINGLDSLNFLILKWFVSKDYPIVSSLVSKSWVFFNLNFILRFSRDKVNRIAGYVFSLPIPHFFPFLV